MAHDRQNQRCVKNRRPRILLGITGSVAAVKGPKLALRLANELKADVKVVLTRTVEQYFWKENKSVAAYDGDSWSEFMNVCTSPTSSTSDFDETSNVDCSDWRLSKGRISMHCK